MTYYQRPTSDAPMTTEDVLALIELRPAWFDLAECATEATQTLAWTLELDSATDLFIRPLGAGRRAVAELHAARTVCGRCAVRTECLAHAYRHNERGIWGGTTDKERKQANKEGT